MSRYFFIFTMMLFLVPINCSYPLLSNENIGDVVDASEMLPEKGSLEKEDVVLQPPEDSMFYEWPCDKVATTFSELRVKYNFCRSDDECTLVGLRGNCDCSFTLDGYGGSVGIPKKYNFFKILEERFFSKECLGNRKCGYDSTNGPDFYKAICRRDTGRCGSTYRFPGGDVCPVP